MCYYITIAMTKADWDTVADEVQPHLLNQEQPPALIEALPDDFEARCLVQGWEPCSCGMYQFDPEYDSRPDPNEERLQRMRAKCKRKGWSDAKTERAARQSIKDRLPIKAHNGYSDDVLDLFQEIARDVRRFAVFSHYYSGPLDEDPLTIAQTWQRTPDTLRDDVIPPDTLVYITST